MKLGSSRGMDTKRQRGSERSKPCHQLQLTRRSQPPYPWPPEQAQPGVSKPCRTTRRRSGVVNSSPATGYAKQNFAPAAQLFHEKYGFAEIWLMAHSAIACAPAARRTSDMRT